MKKVYIKCPAQWTDFIFVNDGKKYRIQNTGDKKIWWCVGEKPEEDERNAILPAGCVLNFQRLNADLYIKDFDPATPSYLYVEQVEEEE